MVKEPRFVADIEAGDKIALKEKYTAAHSMIVRQLKLL